MPQKDCQERQPSGSAHRKRQDNQPRQHKCTRSIIDYPVQFETSLLFRIEDMPECNSQRHGNETAVRSGIIKMSRHREKEIGRSGYSGKLRYAIQCLLTTDKRYEEGIRWC